MAKITPRTWIFIIVGLMAVAVAVLSFRAAASGTVTVSGNTAVGENQPGWLFNRDLATAAPYAFTFDAHSIGLGALKVGPITNTNFGSVTGNDPNRDKFVAEFFPGKVLTSDLKSISYDYMLDSSRTVEDARFVTMSVYINVDDSNNDFDCRYDYVAQNGSNAAFIKPNIFMSTPPNTVTKNGNRIAECAPTPDSMKDGSYVRVIKFSVGDDTADDTGVIAYFDNIEIVMTNDITVYNFEASPRSMQDCDGKKWMQYNFKNQGQCQQFVTKGKDTRK